MAVTVSERQLPFQNGMCRFRTAVTVPERHMPWYVSGRGGTCHRPINDLGPTAICITNLLYSCEAWVTYSRHIKSLEQFNIRCLQRILGITWRDRVPHTEILGRTGCKSIEATITRHQLLWLGHVTRMPYNRLPLRVWTSSSVSMDNNCCCVVWLPRKVY